MKARIIEAQVINSLLRVEGTHGVPPSGWESPSKEGDFWILEITWQGTPILKWELQVNRTLEEERSTLLQFAHRKFSVYLFVETNSNILPVRFGPALLGKLVEYGITLEYYDSGK